MTRTMPTVPMVDPEWVTVQEAAELARRDQKTIYAWIAQDRLASKREHGRVLVPPKAAIRLGETTLRGRPKPA